MDYVLFNSDGNVKKINFTRFIQQNNDEVDHIFVSVDGLDVDNHNLVGVFVLPDGSVSAQAGVVEKDYEYEDDQYADGYLLTLTQTETFIPGVVFLTLQVKANATQTTLYTYRVALTVNESADLTSIFNISLAQYNALKDYIDTNYTPYTGATKDLDLGENDIFAAGALFGDGGNSNYLYFDGYLLIVKKDGNETDFVFPDTGEVETFAVQSQLPKKSLCASFSTGDFTLDEDHYLVSNVAVSNFISGSDLLIITWDNCFAICPIPQSGAGRVVAALWSADGESKIVRVKYELKDSNTKLDISLSGGFTPPSNHTAYVFCYKLVN